MNRRAADGQQKYRLERNVYEIPYIVSNKLIKILRVLLKQKQVSPPAPVIKLHFLDKNVELFLYEFAEMCVFILFSFFLYFTIDLYLFIWRKWKFLKATF